MDFHRRKRVPDRRDRVIAAVEARYSTNISLKASIAVFFFIPRNCQPPNYFISFVFLKAKSDCRICDSHQAPYLRRQSDECSQARRSATGDVTLAES